jgi:hypothetical protein
MRVSREAAWWSAGAVAVVCLTIAGVVSRSSSHHEVAAVITDVRCRWAPMRLGDIVVTGVARNPSRHARDFELAPRVTLPDLGLQQPEGRWTFTLPGGGSRHFWAEVTTSRKSHPGTPIPGCAAVAHSYTPTGDD